MTFYRVKHVGIPFLYDRSQYYCNTTDLDTTKPVLYDGLVPTDVQDIGHPGLHVGKPGPAGFKRLDVGLVVQHILLPPPTQLLHTPQMGFRYTCVLKHSPLSTTNSEF